MLVHTVNQYCSTQNQYNLERVGVESALKNHTNRIRQRSCLRFDNGGGGYSLEQKTFHIGLEYLSRERSDEHVRLRLGLSFYLSAIQTHKMKTPTPVSPSNVDDARAQADVRIAKMEVSLRKLAEEYNTLSYAVRISPEILTHIFLYVINDVHENNLTPIHQLYLPHVCRHWYRVASYSQQYWRYQPLRLEEERRFQAPHLLERAGGRPLHLWGNVSIDNDWDLSTCDLDSQYLSQAESLKISMQSEKRFRNRRNFRVPPYLATFLKKKAPNLKALSLFKDQAYEPFSIEADAFEGETPNLSSLLLSGFSWTWSAPLFPPSLTSLILVGPVAWGEDCIQTLRRLPFLQYLGLEDTTGTTPSDERAPTEVVIPSNPSPSVKLDRLETLVLAKDGTVDTGMARLSLDIPTSTVVLLKSRHLPFPGGNSCDAYPELGPLFSFSQRCLESHQRDHILTGILHVRTELDDSSDANFRLWFTQERISFDDFWNLAETTPTNFQLILISSNDPHDNPQQPIISYPEAIIARVISQLPLSSIHTLYLENIPSISDAGKAFQSLSGVQTLIIDSGDAISILRDLIPALPSGKIQSEEGILLPALSTIILYSASFSRGSDDVLTLMATRSRLNYAVATLQLIECDHVSPLWLQELHRYVAKVEWDGLGAEAEAEAEVRA